jgi:hypothetical protein
MKQRAILVARRRSQTTQVWNGIFAEHAMPSELSHPVFNCRFGFCEFDWAEGSYSDCPVPECPQLGPYYRWFSRKSALHEISRETGGKQVLTFFEYLRRRAFESIVEGAEEAVDFLEAKTERRSSNAEKALTQTLMKLDSEREQESAPPTNAPDSEGLLAESDPSLPPPRRRGRPRSDSKDT